MSKKLSVYDGGYHTRKLTPKQFADKYRLTLTSVRPMKPRKTETGPVFDYECFLNRHIGPDGISDPNGQVLRYTITKAAKLKAPRMPEMLRAIAGQLDIKNPPQIFDAITKWLGPDAPAELGFMYPKG